MQLWLWHFSCQIYGVVGWFTKIGWEQLSRIYHNNSYFHEFTPLIWSLVIGNWFHDILFKKTSYAFAKKCFAFGWWMIVMLNEKPCWRIWKWIVIDHDDVFFVVIVQFGFHLQKCVTYYEYTWTIYTFVWWMEVIWVWSKLFNSCIILMEYKKFQFSFLCKPVCIVQV